MNKIICMLLALIISGCTTLAPKKNESKRVWVPLSCSAELQWDTCLSEAKALCPKGFDVANKKEDLTTQSRSMEISCKGW
jgi:hypothetical protein